MIPILETLPQKTICHGRINGESFRFEGGGMGRPFDGIVSTILMLTEGKVQCPYPLFAPILIMGYPTYSMYHVGAFDLFKLSDGYSYERVFAFENGNKMRTQHTVTYGAEGLFGDFEVVDCSIDIPQINRCDFTVETFFPVSPGEIGSTFSMLWHVKGGGVFRSNVTSRYKLAHSLTLPYQQFRFIEFENEFDDKTIKQTERLNVFRDITKLNLSIIDNARKMVISP